MVTVQSLGGSIRLKASITNDIHPKVVSIQHGWSEANANLLIDDAVRVRNLVSNYSPWESS